MRVTFRTAENRAIGAARRTRLSRRSLGATSKTKAARAAAAAGPSKKKAGANKPAVVVQKKQKRGKSSRQSATAKGKGKAKKKGRQGEVLGILGIPIRGWDVGNCVYDDSDDDTYAPPSSSEGIL